MARKDPIAEASACPKLSRVWWLKSAPSTTPITVAVRTSTPRNTRTT